MQTQMPQDKITEILEDIQKCNPQANLHKIKESFLFANKAHKGVKRKTGEDYIVHPLAVTEILVSKCYADTDLICAALLHDVVEDTDHTLDEIEKLAIPFHSNLHSVGDHNHQCFYYLGTVSSGELVRNDESTAMKWLSREEIEGLENAPENAKRIALHALDFVREMPSPGFEPGSSG